MRDTLFHILCQKSLPPRTKRDGECGSRDPISTMGVTTVTRGGDEGNALGFASCILRVSTFWGDRNPYLNSVSEDGLGRLNS